ncbi:MAG: cell division protein ZapA [Lachnospiraceae bacterium]
MAKKYTDVVIDDKVYSVGGDEDSAYMLRLADYVNSRLNVLRSDPGYSKQPYGARQAMILINFADDYLKMKEKEEDFEKKYTEQEKNYYQLKREMVNLQLKMEQIQLQNQVLSAGGSGQAETVAAPAADSARKEKTESGSAEKQSSAAGGRTETPAREGDRKNSRSKH